MADSTVLIALQLAGVAPDKAIALRGYLRPMSRTIDDLLKATPVPANWTLTDGGGATKTIDELLRAASTPAGWTLTDAAGNAETIGNLLNAGFPTRRRIYLSARFDHYVDFDDSDKVVELPPDPADDSVTIWLKPGTYVVVSEMPLAADTHFVRGQLVDDFMAQPEAQIAWDEQNFATGKARSGTKCYA